ncbi:MAG: recombinase family protein [Deltaproteobacteria bacterium]|nr:recombinase family protein [Deltaproteobacteria bacterium]
MWRLDRLGRTAKGLTALFDDLGQCKVNLVSLKDGLDYRRRRQVMANVLASVAIMQPKCGPNARWPESPRLRLRV